MDYVPYWMLVLQTVSMVKRQRCWLIKNGFSAVIIVVTNCQNFMPIRIVTYAPVKHLYILITCLSLFLLYASSRMSVVSHACQGMLCNRLHWDMLAPAYIVTVVYMYIVQHYNYYVHQVNVFAFLESNCNSVSCASNFTFKFNIELFILST